jgi:HEAT repeat protein
MKFISGFCQVISIQSLKHFLGYCYVSGIILAISGSDAFSQQGLENKSCTTKADIVKLIELGKEPKSFFQVSEQLKKCNQFAVPVLIEYVGIQYDEETRINTIVLIGEFGESAGSAIVALTALSKDPNKNIRVAAVSSLGAIGHSATIILKDILHNGDIDSRIVAAFTLVKHGYFEDSMIPFFTNSLLDQEYSATVHLAIVSVLSERKEAIPVFITALKNSNENVRLAAASALGETREKEAVPALVIALKDSEADVRWNAAIALFSIKGKETVPILITVLKDSNENEDVRSDIAVHLGKIQDRKAVPALIAALKDSNEKVRSNAASALGHIQDKEAVPALIAALKDSNEKVRSNAASALGHIQGKEAVPALITAVKKGSINKCTAITALQRIHKFDIKSHGFTLAGCEETGVSVNNHTLDLYRRTHTSLKGNLPKACNNYLFRWLIAWKCSSFAK